VLTRPLGASFADYTGKARSAHGLGYGDGTVAFVLALVIVALVGYLTVSGVDRQPAASPAWHGAGPLGDDASA
jgi:uncharacterized membrane-anchored protein